MTDRDDIQEHLILKGVTKCPTVFLNKSQASSAYRGDRKMLRQHQDKQNQQADARFKRLFDRRVFYFLLGIICNPVFIFLSNL